MFETEERSTAELDWRAMTLTAVYGPAAKMLLQRDRDHSPLSNCG